MNILEETLGRALQRMRVGELGAVEYARAMLARQRETAHLNALITLDEEQLLAAAALRERQWADGGEPGVLGGAPLLLKDNINSASLPTSGGTPALRDNTPATDAPIVATLLDAGAVIFGKANMHELAFGVTGNNLAFGATKNPYNPKRVAGGSSGGSAVAIAAGVLPAGLGTDTGGSVRLPAAFCGICGFRPTMGRYPTAGVVPISATRDTPGPMARDMADIQLLDQVMAGDPTPPETMDLAQARLGVPRAYYYENLEAGVKTLVEDALDRLASSGAALVEVDLAGVGELNEKTSFPIALYEAGRDLPKYLAEFAPGISMEDVLAQIADPIVKGVYASILSGAAVTREAYQDALRLHRPQLQALFADCFAAHGLDALVIPTAPLTAPPVGHDETLELNGRRLPTMPTVIRNTDPSSNAGIPSLSVAAGLAANGLPVGVCLEGAAGSDRKLLAVGKAVQELLGLPPRPAIRP